MKDEERPSHQQHERRAGPQAQAEVPSEIASQVRRAFDWYQVAPSSRVDDAIERALTSNLPDRARWKVPAAAGLAVAAGLALAFALPSMLGHQTPPAGSRDGGDRGGGGDTFATDGTIIDAFRLAIQIERGETGLDDITGDGNVDANDVESLAMRAVRLGGRS